MAAAKTPNESRRKPEPKRKADSKLKIFVSSSVYGNEEMLTRVDALLRRYGYQVWMSHVGTVPIKPNKSAFDCCLAAVDECDLVLSIISPRYGSGKVEGGLSITHQELERAFAQGKQVFTLAHRNVINARRLLLDLEIGPDERKKLKVKKHGSVVDDLRLLDMYELATKETTPLQVRTGNWVQPYGDHKDVFRYVTEQFKDAEAMRTLLANIVAAQGGGAP